MILSSLELLSEKPTALAVGSSQYSKSKSVEVDSDFVKWAEQNNKTEYIRYKDPEPDKIKLKEVLSKNSAEVPHCHLIEKLNLSIK